MIHEDNCLAAAKVLVFDAKQATDRDNVMQVNFSVSELKLRKNLNLWMSPLFLLRSCYHRTKHFPSLQEQNP